MNDALEPDLVGWSGAVVLGSGLFSAYYQRLPVAQFVVMHGDTRVVAVSDAAAELLAYEPAALLGGAASQILNPEDEPCEILGPNERSPVTGEHEATMIDASGALVAVSMRCHRAVW